MKTAITSLANARKAQGLSQSDLARLCGVSLMTIHNAERKGRVTISTLEKMAAALECKLTVEISASCC